MTKKTKMINSAVFSPDGASVLTAACDSTAKLGARTVGLAPEPSESQNQIGESQHQQCSLKMGHRY